MTPVSKVAVPGWPDLSDAIDTFELEPKSTHMYEDAAYGMAHRIFSMAGMVNVPRRPRLAVMGNRAVVVWNGPLWKQLGGEGALMRVNDSQYVPINRLPGALQKQAVAVVGPNYVMLVTKTEAVAIEHAIKLRRQAYLVDRTLITKDEPLPREKAQGFKQYQVCFVPNKSARFVDIGGNIWDAAGIKMGDAILVTRYRDGVRITKAESGTRKLATKKTPAGVIYSHKRLGETIFRGLVGDTARVAFTKNALLLLGDSLKLAEFGLTEKQLFPNAIPMKDGELDTTPARSIVNHSTYPINRDASRIQVQGEWLVRYGFKPGVKFTVEPHPLVRGRVLVRVDPEGAATVTQHSRPGSAKLYIPTKFIEHFKSPDVRVWGNVEGLHVQQHFASSWAR